MSLRYGLTAAQKRLLDESVHEIGLPVRTANHLEEISVFTVEELLECEREKLLAIPNFGQKTLQEVFKCLAERGLVAKGYVPPPTPAPGAEPKPAAPAFKIPPAFKPRASQFRQKKKKKPKEG